MSDENDFTKYFRNLNSIGTEPKGKSHNKKKPTAAEEKVLSKLNTLKALTHNVRKQARPDATFEKIKHNLGPAESAETLRQERWPEHGRFKSNRV